MALLETSEFVWLFSDHQSKLKVTILGAQASSPWWVSTVSSLCLWGNLRCWIRSSITVWSNAYVEHRSRLALLFYALHVYVWKCPFVNHPSCAWFHLHLVPSGKVVTDAVHGMALRIQDLISFANQHRPKVPGKGQRHSGLETAAGMLSQKSCQSQASRTMCFAS